MRPIERVEVAGVRPAEDAEWDAAWSASAQATFFHSRAWALACSEASGGALRPAARRLELSDGRAVVLPLCEESRGGARYRRLSPAGTYGGWLANEPLGKRHAEALFGWLRRELPGLCWRVSPFDPEASALAAGEGEPETTRLLRTSDGFETLERRFASGARWGARRARREGLEVGVAVALEEWRAYYAAYEASLARWGARATSRHPWELFERLHARGGEHARLWVARLGGAPVAGALVLHAPAAACWWHGAAQEEHLARQPMHLLLHACIRDACEQGLPAFDFGPSHGHAGVESFKAAYGGERVACPMLRTPPSARRAPALRALARLVR